jgi:co-chaperonin GroES (HSP10)
MKIRLKDRYFRISAKSPIDDPVLVSCDRFEERKALEDKWRQGSYNNDKYNKARANLAVGHGGRGEASPVITMDVQHGDLVVMHGEHLQKYFEVRLLFPEIMTR